MTAFRGSSVLTTIRHATVLYCRATAHAARSSAHVTRRRVARLATLLRERDRRRTSATGTPRARSDSASERRLRSPPTDGDRRSGGRQPGAGARWSTAGVGGARSRVEPSTPRVASRRRKRGLRAAVSADRRDEQSVRRVTFSGVVRRVSGALGIHEVWRDTTGGGAAAGTAATVRTSDPRTAGRSPSRHGSRALRNSAYRSVRAEERSVHRRRSRGVTGPDNTRDGSRPRRREVGVTGSPTFG